MTELFPVAALALATGAIATGLSAQPIIDESAFPTPLQTVETDLDGDGRAETVRRYALNDRYDVITIRPPESGGDYDFDAAAIVPINNADADGLEALPNGNLRISWGCFACGRYHTQTSVTVDAREGELLVIGVDDSYADRIFAAVFTCSVNLLTGKAIVEAVGIERRELTTDERSYPIGAIGETLPAICLSAYERYDDDFLGQNYPLE